jgi:hypothetical protein
MRILFSKIALLTFALCVILQKPQEPVRCLILETKAGPLPNALADSEKRVGWKLLFDGRTTQGWRGFRRKAFPAECWEVQNGALRRRGHNAEPMQWCGDLITTDQYENFLLEFEWRISKGGNSGVKYLVLEDRPFEWDQAYTEHYLLELKQDDPQNTQNNVKVTPQMWSHFAMGFEFQLNDDQNDPDVLNDARHKTGALYDLIAPKQKVSSPVGEFNQARISVQQGHVEHWINGVKLLEFDVGSKTLEAIIAKSKFGRLEGFDSVARGYIALQDHGDEVWFRNIKILESPRK